MQHNVIKVCQRLAAGLLLSLGTQVSSTNKTDRHNITEMLLKVGLNTLTLTLKVLSKGGNFYLNLYKK